MLQEIDSKTSLSLSCVHILDLLAFIIILYKKSFLREESYAQLFDKKFPSLIKNINDFRNAKNFFEPDN